MFKKIIIFFFLILLNFSCSKKEVVYEPSKKNDAYKLYEEGLVAFEKNDYFFASKKFSEAELSFEIPKFAAKSAIMSSYSLYGINFYDEAEENLMRYFSTYPADENLIYAHYLLAIVYYEQISDEKKDISPLLKANKQIDFFLKKYPDTDYATDLKFKKDLIQNQLAAKELYISKYYISVQKWIPAIQRLKVIVEKFNTTVFVEEALHRLVEIHYYLGLENEAEKYASILGYNYNSSEWFKQSYKLLNKDYKIANTKPSNEKDTFFKKIIKMIK